MTHLAYCFNIKFFAAQKAALSVMKSHEWWEKRQSEDTVTGFAKPVSPVREASNTGFEAAARGEYLVLSQ